MDAYKARLLALGLSAQSVEVVVAARKGTTYNRYEGYWKSFDAFCVERGLDPFSVGIGPIIAFVEACRSDKNWLFSSVKSCVSSISLFRGRLEGSTVFTHPLMDQYLKGAKKLSVQALRRPDTTWDASLVLRALEKAPFEPMASAEMCYVSAKLAVLLALTTAARGSELTALTTVGLTFSGDLMVTLFPDKDFVPKTVSALTSRAPVVLHAFHPSPTTREEKRLHLSCPVRAVRIYLRRTGPVRRSTRLLVSYKTGHPGPGRAISTQRLAHWLVDGITEAYTRSGRPVPQLKAHSTRGTATSIAVLAGVDWEVIRQTAGWQGDRTFMQHYYQHTHVRSVADAVLEQAR